MPNVSLRDYGFIAYNDQYNDYKANWDSQSSSSRRAEMFQVARLYERLEDYVNNDPNGYRLLNYLYSLPNYASSDSEGLFHYSDAQVRGNPDLCYSNIITTALAQQSARPTSQPTQTPTTQTPTQQIPAPTVTIYTQAPSVYVPLPPSLPKNITPPVQQLTTPVNDNTGRDAGLAVGALGLFSVGFGYWFKKRHDKKVALNREIDREEKKSASAHVVQNQDDPPPAYENNAVPNNAVPQELGEVQFQIPQDIEHRVEVHVGENKVENQFDFQPPDIKHLGLE